MFAHAEGERNKRACRQLHGATNGDGRPCTTEQAGITCCKAAKERFCEPATATAHWAGIGTVYTGDNGEFPRSGTAR